MDQFGPHLTPLPWFCNTPRSADTGPRRSHINTRNIRQMKLGSGQGCSEIQLVGLSLPVTHIQPGQGEQQSGTHVAFSPFPARPRIPLCPRKPPSFLTLCALCVSTLTPSRSPFGCFFSTSLSPELSLLIVSNYNTSWIFFFFLTFQIISKLLPSCFVLQPVPFKADRR